MDETFTQRVRAAAVAGWWTILIMGVWLTLGWFVWLAMFSSRPAWMLAMWGGNTMTWEQMHATMVTFIGVFKVIALTLLMLTIWLSLWARGLRNQAKPGRAG